LYVIKSNPSHILFTQVKSEPCARANDKLNQSKVDLCLEELIVSKNTRLRITTSNYEQMILLLFQFNSIWRYEYLFDIVHCINWSTFLALAWQWMLLQPFF